jgi:molybdopterin-containing oxidoreductase family iron-sulfur binding subunit
MLDLSGSASQENKELKILNNNEANSRETNYWRSFKELYNDSSFIEESHNEFKKGVTDDFNPGKLSGLSRRKFLALVGASAALAGAGCNYRDKGEIIPYNTKPEEITIGRANLYASTINGLGVLVKTREGRPVKIDGNPDHPVSKGKVDAKILASILNLYDPERLKHPLKGDRKGNFRKYSWTDADQEIINELSKAGGKEIALVTHKIISPLTKKVIDEFILRYPSTRVYSYELHNDSIRNSAWSKENAGSLFPLIKWNNAKIIVALESDFLGSGEDKVENARLFAEGRNIANAQSFNRLYVVEGNMSVTGMNSDYRLRLRPDAQYEFVLALLNEIAPGSAAGLGNGNASLNSVADKYKLPKDKLKLLVNDLKNNRGASIVHAGNELPESVHIAVNRLNSVLGNNSLYRADISLVSLMPLTNQDEWSALAGSMNAGNVAAVIHLDTNPVFHLPQDINYINGLKKVPLVVTLCELENESSQVSDYVLPLNHDLESWGDAKTRSNFISVKQPVINPLLDTRQKEAVLLTWMSGKTESFNSSIVHDYMRKYYESDVYPVSGSPLAFEQFWYGALHDGIILISGQAAASPAVSNPALQTVLNETSGYALILKESYNIGDGRYSNNGWLQELPHPVTKVSWDNYAAISPASAKELGVKYNDIIKITAGNRSLEIPVYIQPGSADKTITIELGYGRTKTGTVGAGAGFNANKLMSAKGGLSPWLYTGVKVSKTGGSYEIVTSQEHHVFDKELTKDIALRRGIIREGTVAEYISNPHFMHEDKGHSQGTFYPDWKYTGLKWGMVIDMNKCLGCGECVIGCISENNIPVVGKDQVKEGREMHWIRVDRYYSGSEEEPKVHNQVMLCQHCDHAPCENVCPVVATTHSPDGLNQMVYNRCVGTRYCSNNCPYKVRRFNYFNFRDHFNNGYQESALLSLIYNPEVTVRSRGVMEKCTFCVQRIMEEKQDAVKENRAARGSNVTTACQDACITNAITFGDVNDRDSDAAKLKDHELGYYVLEEINTRPNVTYLARLRNTHTKSGAKLASVEEDKVL